MHTAKTRRRRTPARLRRPAPIGLVLTLALALGCGGSRGGGRVLMVGIDGLDPRVVDLLMSEGKMPNFAELRQNGAYGKLLSQKPLLSPIIWTTIATGKGADQHGIGHFVAISEEDGEQLPVTSRMRKVKAIWNIASELEKKVAVVGWWATWPPEDVNGVIVSDHTGYHFLFEEGFEEGHTQNTTSPQELFAEIEPMLRRPDSVGYEELQRFVDVDPSALEREFDYEDELAHFRWAYATALSYRDIGLELWRQEKPDLGMIYIEGVDSSSHLFGHLFRAEGLGGELAEQQKHYGRVVEEMYRLADEIVGEALAAMDDDTTLVVLSDHGFDLGTLHDDPSRTRDLRRVSERFHNVEGTLYLYGNRIKEHQRIDRPSIIDIAPTTLQLLGVPAARDMPGRVLAEALDDAPDDIRIASYEGGGQALPAGEIRDGQIDDAVQARLRSLGYLGGDVTSSPQGDRNLAAIQFEAGNYREAAKLYRDLIEKEPEDASLRTSLAGVLGAMGRYDEALVELEEAIEISPLNVEAFHNRAVIRERQGDVEAAIADYTEAVRYRPDYEPSRAALLRLTGSANVGPPLSATEEQARQVAEIASLEARRGNYQEAMAMLDRAARVAPSFALVYQYQANVAYLMGDGQAARAALEKGLEIEPDNALFAENLRRLEESGK